mgnify:FL=1
MKINLKKLTKLQEEFKEGNLLQNITAWDILEIIDEESSTISLHSLIKAMEEGDIHLKEDILKEYGIDELTREEDSILRDCDEKLHITTQFMYSSDNGNIMLMSVSYENNLVKLFSYYNHEHSDGELYTEDINKITKKTVTIYGFVDKYEMQID